MSKKIVKEKIKRNYKRFPGRGILEYQWKIQLKFLQLCILEKKQVIRRVAYGKKKILSSY